MHQLLRLAAQAAGRCCHLFYQRSVLLGHLVHLCDGFAHLGYTAGLFTAGGADFPHDVGDAADG